MIWIVEWSEFWEWGRESLQWHVEVLCRWSKTTTILSLYLQCPSLLLAVTAQKRANHVTLCGVVHMGTETKLLVTQDRFWSKICERERWWVQQPNSSPIYGLSMFFTCLLGEVRLTPKKADLHLTDLFQVLGCLIQVSIFFLQLSLSCIPLSQYHWGAQRCYWRTERSHSGSSCCE